MDEPRHRRKREDMWEQAGQAALSGAAYGAPTGALARILAGGRSLGAIGKSALAGGLASAALSGGSTLLGNALMGEPLEGEPGAYTHRGAIGGGAGGAILGAGLGALIGSGKLKTLSGRLPFIEKLVAKSADEIPMNNVLADKIKEWGLTPGTSSALKTAGALGAIGGGAGAYWGGTEGMQSDYVNSQIAEDEMRRRYGV